MPLAFLSLPPFPPPPPLSFFPKLKPTSSFNLLLKPPLLSTSTAISAIGPDGKYYPTPSDDDPPEAPEDSMHGVNKFQQIQRQAARARKIQEEEYKKDQPVFLKALEETEDIPASAMNDDSGDDLFGEIDKAIALKRQEFIKKGLIKPSPKKKPEPEIEVADELDPEEVVDLEEIEGLHGLTEISDDDGVEEIEDRSDFEVSDGDFSNSFDIDFDEFGKTKARIVEPKFKMSLAELLDESKVVPISVYENDGHLFLSEADKRGAVAVVASKEIDIEDTLGWTNGKTTTSFLIKGMYEAMGLRTGMLSTVAYYVHGDNKLESTKTTPDAVMVQKLMAKMVHNGTEALVMEASSHGLALGRCDEIDFDIAVFTNLTRDHLDFHGSEEEYRDAKAKLFSRMVDPARHRKIVNIDDPNASFFITQGNPDVPVVTFAMENKNADVHPLRFELSLFETQVLVNTPQGILEISSGLLGRHNIYNILAAVAVGIAVGAPLEDIVRGIEEVDAVPGRCELIDEEQAFGVIVDYAHTPDALSRLLDYVRELAPRRIITGMCFISFGLSFHREEALMAKIATDKSDITILTSDNPRNEDPCPTVTQCVEHISNLETLIEYYTEKSEDNLELFHQEQQRTTQLENLVQDKETRIADLEALLAVTQGTLHGREQQLAIIPVDVDILDDMLAGVGWTMQDYLKHGENDYYPPLPNGHRLFLHDIRRVAVRCAVAMGEEGDIVVVAGKGHETYQIEGEKKDFFDDREECREALQYVDELHQAESIRVNSHGEGNFCHCTSIEELLCLVDLVLENGHSFNGETGIYRFKVQMERYFSENEEEVEIEEGSDEEEEM
ncbi:hypothetical protein DH2020_036233 [Rehmannia glutinosa]|uniref:Uncharacterized protein n=1 Tax=Rehmannia glutinosa TaxID=99300 RepID=A0ABR0V527_REHGL